MFSYSMPNNPEAKNYAALTHVLNELSTLFTQNIQNIKQSSGFKKLPNALTLFQAPNQGESSPVLEQENKPSNSR